MKNHRVLTFAGAGSALAATVVIVATLLIPTPGGTVGAETIFASLHEAVNNAFTITYEDIGILGLRAEGEVVVLFDNGDDDPSDSSQEAAALYFGGYVQAGEGAPVPEGFAYEYAGSFSLENMWVYMKTGEIPQALVQKNPLLGIYAGKFQDGLLLDMGGLLEQIQGVDWEAYAKSASGQQSGVIRVEDLSEQDESTDADTAAVTPVYGEKLDEMLSRLGGTSGYMSFGSPVMISANDELNNVFSSLLMGKAGPEDFDRLATLFEESAGAVKVTTQSDGSYLLRATEFDFSDAGLGSEIAGLFENMTFEIAYDQSDGLLWATMEHVGPHEGTIRFERTEVDVDDPMFSDQRYREDGVTKILDLSGLGGMLRGLGG